MIKRSIQLLLVLMVASQAGANTPGKHTVALSWADAGATSSYTYNIYRGTASGVCNGTPTPYVTGVTTTSFVDTNAPAATYYYNVSAVNSATGGESTCNGEVQVTVPPITTASPTGLAGTVQ